MEVKGQMDGQRKQRAWLRLKECCSPFTQADPDAAELDTVPCERMFAGDSEGMRNTELGGRGR